MENRNVALLLSLIFVIIAIHYGTSHKNDTQASYAIGFAGFNSFVLFCIWAFLKYDDYKLTKKFL